MNERFRDISFPLLKREMEPLLAYENRKESRTPKELALLNDNEHAIQMEGLIMRERILENGNKELCYLLKYREAFFADHGKYASALVCGHERWKWLCCAMIRLQKTLNVL